MIKRLLLLTALFVSLLSTAYALDPAVYDAVMYANEDYRLNLTLKDSTGAAMNLTGYSYKAQFRQQPAPAGAVYATYSATVSNAATGAVTVKLSKSQTSALSGLTGFWDLQQTDSGGSISYLLSGRAVVKTTVTR